MTRNLKAFLDTIAVSELGKALLELPGSDDGYRVLVGSTASNPVYFGSFADHPRQAVYLPRLGLSSTAAGRYQVLARTYDAYKRSLNLPDFSPASQDAIAVQMLKECRAIPLIESGDFAGAVDACKRLWASLPDAGHQQHENKLSDLRAAYVEAGGFVTEQDA